MCGAGDGFDLLMKVKNKSFKEMSVLVRKEANKIEPESVKVTEKIEEQLHHRQKKLWLSSRKPPSGGAVDTYLYKRLKGRFFDSPCIREMQFAGNRFAMVSKVATPEGKAANLHLTWITSSGQKADVPVKKQLMAGSLPGGSAIRLMPSAPKMGIAEGIETAISAHFIFNMPVWAAISANNLVKWTPPAGVEDVWIFGDHDTNFVGQSSAYNLAQRLHKQGFNVVVLLPEWPHKDWNDALRDEQ